MLNFPWHLFNFTTVSTKNAVAELSVDQLVTAVSDEVGLHTHAVTSETARHEAVLAAAAAAHDRKVAAEDDRHTTAVDGLCDSLATAQTKLEADIAKATADLGKVKDTLRELRPVAA